jgi:Putative peptidoglycan binding domain
MRPDRQRLDLLNLLLLIVLEILLASNVVGQTGPSAPRMPAVIRTGTAIHLSPAPRANFGNSRIAGLPAGPVQLPYPLTSTPANDAWVRNNAWAAYNASLRQIPTAANPNRLAQQQNLLDQGRFVEKPTSAHRYNFQFSDNEVRSVQAALRRIGIYSGQVDGILGPDTQRAIEKYQVQYNRPVTGQPDQWLNASLGIF